MTVNYNKIKKLLVYVGIIRYGVHMEPFKYTIKVIEIINCLLGIIYYVLTLKCAFKSIDCARGNDCSLVVFKLQ